MTPVRKSKSVNKRFSYEASPGKSKQRKKNKLGPHWSKGELRRFYEAFRTYGDDWKKVAAAIRSRSVEMVEAIFTMNQYYLSLPEGTASVAGLIAMMTDHYNVMEENSSEGEGHDESEVPRKSQKRKRGNSQLNDSREEIAIQYSFASTDGCLKYLRQAQANGTLRRVTGKRTPRFLVQPSTSRDDRECSTPNKSAKKPPKVSETPNRKAEHSESLVKNSRGEMTRISQSKYRESYLLKDVVGSSRKRNFESDRDAALLMDMEGVGEMKVLRKDKKFYKKKVRVVGAEGNDSDDNGEACCATDGFRIKPQSRKADAEASRGKYPRHSPNKSDNELTCGDEFDALQTLAELSLLMEPESSEQLKEERPENDMAEKSSPPEATSTSNPGKKANAEPDDSLLHAISAVENAKNRKPKHSRHAYTDYNAVPTEKLHRQPTSGSLRRKPKLKFSKVLGDEGAADSSTNKSLNKKELTQVAKRAQSKQLKNVKELEEFITTSDKKRHVMDVVASTKQASDSGPASLLPKLPNRRKMSLKKSLLERVKSYETIQKAPRSSRSLSQQELLLKDKLSTSLLYPLARRRCIFEWFYSAIDDPWFAKMEFVDYLNHVGLGHIPRLTRLEWSVIKSSLGKPRRLSERFVQEERDKLKQYRESVRKHYTELRTGVSKGLPTDLARPMSVGDRVIAIHPKTREIHDGKILTVDHNKCNVMFDDLGVELVMDIDCMPSNPSEYMPERKIATQLSGNSNQGVSVIFPPSGHENVGFPMNPTLNQGDMNAPILHGKLSTNSSGRQQTNGKTREAEIQQAFALRHALDEKEMEPEMIEIYKGSKSKAQAMVDAAIKAASSVKEGEDSSKMIQEALDSIVKHQPLLDSRVKHEEHANGSIGHHQNQSPSDTSEPMPSELITSCVATWLMIQMCTERQYPLDDVAQLIDAAIASLQPRYPQNLTIYREIQTCMGRLKAQILALIPTQ